MLALFDSGRLRRPLSRREREVTSGRETKAAGGKRSSAGEGKGRGERETDLGSQKRFREREIWALSFSGGHLVHRQIRPNSSLLRRPPPLWPSSGLLLHQAHPFPSREARYISSSFLLVSFLSAMLSALFCFCGCRLSWM